MKALREPTLATIGLGNVLKIFQAGRLPVTAKEMVERVFGRDGSLVISGVNGIVGAGKMMQLASRLEPFGVSCVGLDLPEAPNGLKRQYPGLVRAFGETRARQIMAKVTMLTYDGVMLPEQLAVFKPRVVIEAVPERLELKKAHYQVWRQAFPDVEIYSVTSGFPSSKLGVPVAHPAFPHESNKVWEIVEEQPSDLAQLFWTLGLIPIPVSDHWSFVLDVLFCGLTLTGLRYHRQTNMPFWKIDKYLRKFLGPNPFRAHDAIGAKGANFLTWSCLHHLTQAYGEMFQPTPELEEHKESGQDWYPSADFRPIVNWSLSVAEENEFKGQILKDLVQMAQLLMAEKRAHLSHINAIGELCAQFQRGILAVIRMMEPEVFEKMEESAWQQLYVNAEHDGNVGVITIGRESYNWDVDAELNRAIDWLLAEGIGRVIVTGDFHLTTQLVGADISEFFLALKDAKEGERISRAWSKTARRLANVFKVSVGFVNGKRCLGGMLELLLHCHYLVALHESELGFPEVTLPVVPGMEGCHWPFRKARPEDWPKILKLLLEGKPVRAKETVGWLIDFTGSMDECLVTAWQLATDGDHGLKKRLIHSEPLEVEAATAELSPAESQGIEAARRAIVRAIQRSCSETLADAMGVQAIHSGGFMKTPECQQGRVGRERKTIMEV